MVGKWIPLWAIPLLISFSIGTVWLRLSIIRTTYEINQTNRKIEESRKERENFQLKVAALRSPRRLEVLARTRFRLAQPHVEQVVQLKRPEIVADGP